MELSTARRLAALNKAFYAEQAENFAETRPRLAAGVQRVLARLTAGQDAAALAERRVLEVGCGDGKAGRALRRAGVGLYVGVDNSEAMLARARRYSPSEDSGLQWIMADLGEPGWARALPADAFDWVLAFGVFHHLPAAALRAAVMRELAGWLKHGGTLAMSNWQFTRSARLRQRVRPWADAGLDEGEVEPGDYLLSWERKGTTRLRYVHVLDEAEARALAEWAGLRVVEVFQADGVGGDLAEYVVMERLEVRGAFGGSEVRDGRWQRRDEGRLEAGGGGGKGEVRDEAGGR
jgi:SAM-dependent methyltransferase